MAEVARAHGLIVERKFEGPLPINIEAERAVLGAILLDNNALKPAIAFLRPDDFFYDHHRQIYIQMIAMDETQQAIDLVTLTDQLHRAGKLESAGGHAYIAELMDGVPHVTNIEHYSRIVREKSLLRGLIHATHAIQRQALEAADDVSVILDRAKSSILALAKDSMHTVPADDWPAPMSEEAFHGLAGEFVRLVEPHTEADRVALLGNFIVGSGALFGSEAHVVADGKQHFAHEFILTVGASGSGGRKGTASERTWPVLRGVEEKFLDDHVVGGLSSGEGLISAISKNCSTEGARRFLAYLPEFASLLAVMKRDASTMSSCLRQAWDGDRLQVTTRNNPLSVDRVHLGVIAHVTKEELLSSLTATDRVNGFANRFLIVCVRRSKVLPEGGGDVNLSPIIARLHEALDRARGRECLQRDAEAKQLWQAEYPRLTNPRTGMKGAFFSRSEAHVMRLSLLYALLDSADEIRVSHLRAALAFWRYCEASVEHIFGTAIGDQDAEKIRAALMCGPMTVTDVRRLFSNNQDGEWIEAKMAALVRSGLVRLTTKDGERKKSIRAWALKGA